MAWQRQGPEKSSGDQRIREPGWQAIHCSTSAQVTVLTRAPECALVRPGCGTSALYSLQDVAPWSPVLKPLRCRLPGL